MLKGYQSQGAKVQQPTQLSTASLSAAVDAGQQLSSKLQEFKNFRDKQASVQAQTDASAQAYQDSVEGKPFNQRVNNTYGAVYNQVRTATYSAKAELQLAERSAKAAQEFENDPEGYDNSFNSFVASLSESAPTPELKATIKITGDKRRTATYGALKQEEAKRIKADAVQTFARSWDLNINQIIELNKSDKERADFEKGKNLAYLNTMVKNGIIDSSTAQKITIDANYKIEYGTAVNKMATLLTEDTLDSAKKFLIAETQKAKESMDYTQNTTYNTALLKMVNTEEKKRKAAIVNNTSVSNMTISNAIDTMKNQQVPENMLEVSEAVKNASPAKVKEFELQTQAFKIIQQYGHLSLSEQQNILNEFESRQEISPVDREVADQIKSNLQERSTAAKNDVVGLAIREGIIKDIPPMGAEVGIGGLVEGLATMMPNMSMIQSEYGSDKTDMLSKQDAKSWADKMSSNQTPMAEKLEVIKEISKLNPSIAKNVLKQIGGKDAPSFAFAAEVALAGNEKAAKYALMGKGADVQLPESYKADLKIALGSAFGGYNSEVFNRNLNGIVDYTKGLVLNGEDVDDIKDNIKNSIGEIRKYNGKDTVLPQNVTKAEFEKWLDNIEIPGRPATQQGLRDMTDLFGNGDYQLHYAGQGEYLIRNNNEGNPYFVQDTEDPTKPFILKWKSK